MKTKNGNVSTKWQGILQKDLVKIYGFLPSGSKISKVTRFFEFLNFRNVCFMEIIYTCNGEIFRTVIKKPQTGNRG
jgi:hypothetical protein